MLLMIDFLSLRAREYTFLTRMFQEWEVSLQQASPVRWGRPGSWGSPLGWAGGGCWAREQEVFVASIALWGLSHGQAGIPKSLE